MRLMARVNSWLRSLLDAGEPSEAKALKLILQGNTFEELGQPEKAQRLYVKALALAPNLAKAHLSLGNILLAKGQTQEAILAYTTALKYQPNYAAAYFNLGNANLHQDKPHEAISCYQKSIAIEPGFADAHFALGRIFDELNCFEEAAKCHQNVLRIQPGSTAAYGHLASSLYALGNLEDAVISYQNMVKLEPTVANTRYALSQVLMAAGRVDDARREHLRALEFDASHANARWALAMAQIRPLYDSLAELEQSREAFAQSICELNTWFTRERAVQGAQAVGSTQPFYLAYQARNNRSLIETYGQLCVRLMSERSISPDVFTRARSEKIRIGIVSAHVHDHSVWNAITKGWIQNIDQRKFEVHVFSLGRYRDIETVWARSEATDFVDGNRTLAQWSQVIQEAGIDALVYPEIGMNTLTTQLAAQRLAPVQFASWGHPHTTGLPTIDYFVSAEILEPRNSGAHYSEKLLRLPNLGVYIEPMLQSTTVPDFVGLGLPSREPLLICAGVPFKYGPEQDAVWAELGRQLQARGSGRLVFFRSQRVGLNEQLDRRLRREFHSAGVDFERVVCQIPTLPRDQFYGLMQRATVMLDTIGFSGFNTALQGLECGLPVVAFEGEFMRGRLASGLLRRMGLDRWVANTTKDYIDKAMELTNDGSAALALREDIANRINRVYRDMDAVRSLEEIIVKTVAERRG